jgi:hypothetical protein
MRRHRKVSGSAYGSPSFAPINPDAHRMTNKPGAAAIVSCSIDVIAGAERRTSCGYSGRGVWNSLGTIDLSTGISIKRH